LYDRDNFPGFLCGDQNLSSIQKVVGRITKLFSGKEPPPEHAKKRKSSNSARKVHTPEEKAEPKELASLAKLEIHLNNLSSKGGVAIAGKVQVLVLDDLRERLGDDWDRLREKVNTTVESTIKKHVGSKDMVAPYGEFGHLIVFSGLTEDEATLKCIIIRDEIFNVLFGKSQDDNVTSKGDVKREDIQIITAATSVTGGIELRSLENIDELFERLQSPSKVESSDEGGEPQGEEDLLGKNSENTGENFDPDWKPFTTPSIPAEEEEDDQEFPEEKHDKQITNWKSDEVGKNEVLKPLQGLDYVYRPLWDTGSKNIRFLAIIPVRQHSTERLETGYNAIGKGVDEGTYVSLDINTLSLGLKATTQLAAHGGVLQLLLPVHFQTLASSKYRGHFATACSKIPENVREDIFFEIVGIPPGIPSSRLQELVMGIRQYGGGMAVRAEIGKPEFSELKNIGVDMVGFSLDAKEVPEEKAMDVIGNFVNAASAVGMVTYATGMPSMNFSMSAVGMGVTLIGSPFFSSITKIPTDLQTFDVAKSFGVKIY
jgi:hypothetical protein